MQTDRRRAERRREPRFETRLWVGIPDVDGEPELEKCNISAAGMLLRTRRDAGAPGAVRMLRLVTADLGVEIEIMARVVRVVATEDVERGRVIEATAFEFLPHQPRELEDFLCEALGVEMSEAPAASVEPRVPAGATDLPGNEQPACVSALSVSGMVIDTNRAVEAGTRVWVEIEMPSSRSATRFAGRAVEGRPIENAGDEQLYRVEVGFNGELEDEPGEKRGDSSVADPASTLVPDASPDFYMCGPTLFMKSLLDGLLRWDVPAHRIHYEFFGPASALEERARIATPKSLAKASECCTDIEIKFSESGVTANWNPSFESILDLAEANGLSPDYSCRSGICHTCLCPLEEGEVEYVLEPLDPPDPGSVLICCSKPTTDVVVRV